MEEKREIRFTFRRANMQDARAITDVIDEAVRNLKDPSLFVADDYEYVCDHIDGEKGYTVVACDPNEKVVGYLIIKYPQPDENLGIDIDLPESELPKVVHMDTAAVLPEARGNHLERRLLQYGEELLDTKNYQYLMATVSPDNHASYRSVEALGYRHMLTKEKYNGKIRRIYLKKLEEK